MDWKYNNIRIFVQANDNEASQIVPRLQPLSGKTVLQFFGYESPIKTINAYVVGDTDKQALEALYKTATSYDLTSPMGDFGNFFLHKIHTKQIANVCQTLRPDLASDAPMYLVDLELYPDE